MGPLGIVELNVLLYSPIQVQSCLIGVQVDVLILDAPPEPLNVYVVCGSSPAIHTDPELGLCGVASDKRLYEDVAGELASLVGVEDPRPAVPLKGLRRYLFIQQSHCKLSAIKLCLNCRNAAWLI